MQYQITFADGTTVFQTIPKDDPYLLHLKRKYKVKEIYVAPDTCTACES